MEAERMVSDSQAQISEMIDSASELNGEKVFLSSDGTRAETLDGRILSDDERDQVHWRPDAASLENIRAAQRRQDKIVAYQAEIARVQNTVDTHQETLAHDVDTPTTSDELADMDQQITGTMQKLEVMRAGLTQNPDTARDLVADFNAKSPTLDFDGLMTPPKSDPLALQH